MESEKTNSLPKQPSHPRSTRLQAAKGFHSSRASSVLLYSLTKGLVIWRTGCHVFIIRSSGQTGSTTHQGFLANRKHKRFPYELDWEGATSPDPGSRALTFCPCPPDAACRGFYWVNSRAIVSLLFPSCWRELRYRVTCQLPGSPQSPHPKRLRAESSLPFSFSTCCKVQVRDTGRGVILFYCRPPR